MRQNWISIVGFQKGRFSLRGTCYCDCFCVIFGTKLGGVLLIWLCFKKGVWLLLSCSFIGSSSSQNWRSKLDKIGFLVGFGAFRLPGTISSRISEGTFRPPGNLLLRLILRHFRHEVRWCFAVSAVFRKRSLAAGFLLFIRSSRSNQNWTKSKLDKIRFLVGFQKGRFGLRGTYYCD